MALKNLYIIFLAGDDSSDSEAEVKRVEIVLPTAPAKATPLIAVPKGDGEGDDDDSESSIDWGSDSSSSGESSDEYDKNITIRERFLKRYVSIIT